MTAPVLSRARLYDLLTSFKEQYTADYHLLALGYFGSYARNEARDDSDVDIFFDTDTPNLLLTTMLKQDLEAWLGQPVDVLQVRGLINARLRERIEAEAVYV